MNYLRQVKVENKRVLVRVDFNVPLEKGEVSQYGDWRITATLPTIKYLVENKAKVILLTHLGRPKFYQKEYSLEPVARYLSKLIGQQVIFFHDCLDSRAKRAVYQMEPGQVALLENIRFYRQELENDPDFARQLAELGELYVNDAFGVNHRAHASVVGLAKHLPNCAGLLLEKELKNLAKATNGPSPQVAIIGGVKVSTKLKVIKYFLDKVDDLLLGGALANTVIAAKGIAIGRSIAEPEMIDEVKKLELTNTKLHIPVDAVASVESSGGSSVRIAPVGNTKEDEMILDIGPDTIELFEGIIHQARSIIWNGPMGLFEVEKFAQGSEKVAQAVAQSRAFTVVGGGDSVSLLEKVGLIDKIDHVSTGGGAMLSYLAGEKLPGLEALD